MAGRATYQPGVEGAVRECGSAILDIVEEVVGYLENTLTDNVLVGPVQIEPVSIALKPWIVRH